MYPSKNIVNAAAKVAVGDCPATPDFACAGVCNSPDCVSATTIRTEVELIAAHLRQRQNASPQFTGVRELKPAGASMRPRTVFRNQALDASNAAAARKA